MSIIHRLLGVLIVKAAVTFDFEHSVFRHGNIYNITVVSLINARGEIKVTHLVSFLYNFYYKCILALKRSYFTYIPDEELKCLSCRASIAIILKIV